jgi:hypothetical protein
VAEDEIEVFNAHAFEAAVHGLDQVLAVQGMTLIGFVVDPPKILARHQIARTTPAQFFQCRAHHFFGHT